jgi:S-adenosylmethionine uptake transporter
MTLNANLKGALLMTASMGSFTLNDVFVKLLAEDMPLFQIVFLRSVLTAILLAMAAAAMGQLRLRPGPGDRARLTWRTLFEIATMVAFLYALVNMPIANATAILAALPLSVTLAAAVFLKEPLGWRRMSAVLVGFVGVMLIVQPGTDGFNAFSLSAMLAVLFITGRDLVTRGMGPGLPSLGVAHANDPAADPQAAAAQSQALEVHAPAVPAARRSAASARASTPRRRRSRTRPCGRWPRCA